MPAMRLQRHWWLAIAIAVVAVAGLTLSQTVFRRVPEECRPVQDFLAFNKSQAELIASKSDGAEGVPTAAEETAYAAWADGLSDRAGKVTSPELAQHAVQVASLANQFVAKLSDVRAETQARAPGAPAPPAVYEISALNDRITDELAQLSKACTR